MLLTDYNELYINNNKVTEAYFNNVKVYPKSDEPISGNPFEVYSWSQIQSFVQQGVISSIVPLGTRVTIAGTEYMTVDYTYAGLDTLVLLATESVMKTQWASTSSYYVSYYNSTARQKVINYIRNLPNEVYNVLCPREVEYSGGDKGTYVATVSGEYGTIPSMEEMYGSNSISTCATGTRFRYFEEGNTDWNIADGVWTRSRRNHSSRNYICTIVNPNTYFYSYQTNNEYMTPVLFIG